VAALIFKSQNDDEEECDEDQDGFLTGLNKRLHGGAYAIPSEYYIDHHLLSPTKHVRSGHRKPYEVPKRDETKLAEMRDKREKEVKMWGMFKEIVTYFIYVVIICTLSYDSRDINSYRVKEELENIFTKPGINQWQV
jgi:hypothetical protein